MIGTAQEGRAADTIFALASGAGRAAIAVIRLSGPHTGAYLAALSRPLPAPRRASLRTLRAADGAMLDNALVLWLPAPGSFTGEDSAELHIHGGRAVLEAVSASLLQLGARPASPGEFSRRAFLNGRMDLLEAEAIADLVAAETQGQLLQALRQLGGAQSAILQDWRGRLRWVLAQQEALIDFPDEDLPATIEARLVAEMQALAAEIAAQIQDSARGVRLREGLVFAISGAPNVGKSSLLNALVARDVAIVSPLAGTTRDVLEVTIDLGGVPVTLIDTAGLRETDDPVEAEGVRRARMRVDSADLVVRVIEAGAAQSGESASDLEVLVANKSDLGGPYENALPVSALTGENIAALRHILAGHARRLASSGADPVMTRARHQAALRDASEALDAALGQTHAELRAEELRLAMAALGRITGAVDVESLLDAIFMEFCIGK